MKNGISEEEYRRNNWLNSEAIRNDNINATKAGLSYGKYKAGVELKREANSEYKVAETTYLKPKESELPKKAVAKIL